MSEICIYIDGADGTGKSTLVNMLKEKGYTNVYDRSVLTKISLLPIGKLPRKIPDNKIIIDQIKNIKRMYSTNELKTNRDLMTKLNLNDLSTTENGNENTKVIYIILDAEVDTCLDRLAKREKETNIKLNAWDSKTSIQYFKSKYIFLAYKYQIPIISSENKTCDQVLNETICLIEKKYIYKPKNEYIKVINNNFSPDILELEWINLGHSDILYADNEQIVYSGSIKFDILLYQKNFLQTMTEYQLNIFINELCVPN